MDNCVMLNETVEPFRVSELMIFDWISTPLGKEMVRSISQEGYVLCGDDASSATWKKYNEYEISGVSLDWETLMNNGFVERKNKIETYLCSLHKCSNSIEWEVLLEEVFVDNEFRWNCTISRKEASSAIKEEIIKDIKIGYVHELQHVLKLVGVKIEVTDLPPAYVEPPLQ